MMKGKEKLNKQEKIEKLKLIFALLATALVIVGVMTFYMGYKIGVKRAYHDFVAYNDECKLGNEVLNVYVEDGMYRVRCLNPWTEAIGFA